MKLLINRLLIRSKIVVYKQNRSPIRRNRSKISSLFDLVPENQTETKTKSPENKRE